MEGPDKGITSIRDVLQIISFRKGLFFIGFFGVFVLALGVTFLMSPTYQASTKILVEPMSIPYFGTGPASQYAKRAFFSTQLQIIKGRIITEKVVRQVGLGKSTTALPRFSIPFIKLKQDNPYPFRTAVDNLIKHSISARLISGTNIIEASIKRKDPVEASFIANTLAQIYVDYTLESMRSEAHSAYDFIAEQVDMTSQKLKEAEESLRRFKEKTAASEGEAGAYLRRLSDLNSLLSTALADYTENDPRVVRTKQEISRVEAKLKNLPQKELKLTRLTRAVKANEGIYLMLLKKLENARISEMTDAEKIGTVRIIEPALVPIYPTKHSPWRKLQYLVLGFIGAGIFGFGLAFFAEYQDHSLKTSKDVEQYMKSKVLGTIPLTPKKKRKCFLGFGS